MITNELDELLEKIKKIDNLDDVTLNSYAEVVKQTIEKYSTEDIIEYFKTQNLQEDEILLLIACSDKLQVKEFIPTYMQLYSEKKISFDALTNIIDNILTKTNSLFDKELEDEFVRLVGEDKLVYIFEHLSKESQTNELFEKYMDHFLKDYQGIEYESGKMSVFYSRIRDICSHIKPSTEKIDIIMRKLDNNGLLKNKEREFDDDKFYIKPIEVVSRIWASIDEKDISILEHILEYCKDANEDIDKELYQDMIRNTDPDNIECIRMLFSKYFNESSQDMIDKKIKRFYDLNKINKDFYSTIDMDFLDEKFDKLSLEQIIRISGSYENGGERFFIQSNIENNFWGEIINFIKDDEDFFEKIAMISSACMNYRRLESCEDIFENYSYSAQSNKTLKIDSSIRDKIIEIILKDPNNIFGIKDREGVENYEKNRKEICLKILKEEEGNFSEKINAMSNDERKKFALFELLYGIDYEQAENLIKKYGENIEKIEAETSEEQILKDYIKSLTSIMQLDDLAIQQMMKNKEFIQFLQETKPPKIASSLIPEKDIVTMFERTFNQEISHSSKPKSGSIEFEGENIPTYTYTPIDENGNFTYTEFSVFVRQEGAYTKWENPESYMKYFNFQSATSHGNCESFINQSQIATARSKGGPKSGYEKASNLLMMAPWDIVSSFENMRVSPINAKWNIGRGIEYRIPKELVNYTRHGHGEIVSERIEVVSKNGMTKKLPNQTIFVKERHNEKVDELDDQQQSEWHEIQRMAKEMNIPITIIDREGFAIQEEMVIQRDLELLGGIKAKNLAGIEDIEILTGKKCEKIDWSKKPELTREELIREIIVRFENNAIGMKYADIKDRYFTDEKREEVIDTLMKIIENEKETNPILYYKDLETIEKIIIEEKSKEVTSTGSKVYQISKTYMELEHKIDQILVNDKKRESFTKINNKHELDKVIEFIYDSQIYDDNKMHSTDHIAKTTLFADILAQREEISDREKTLLLIAASMHDSGREGEDGDKPHAVLSAEKAGRLLYDENSTFKECNLKEDEIKLIQLVIEYHEVYEENPGKLQIEELKKFGYYGEKKCLLDLMAKYELTSEYLEGAKRLCAILKDADALDRERFADINSSTNIKYLHTESAKDIRMLVFADRLNNKTANLLLQKYYDENQTSTVAVERLKQKRAETLENENQKLTREEIYDAISEFGIDLKDERSIQFLRQQYDEEKIGSEDIQKAVKRIREEYENFINQEKNVERE